MRRLYLRGFGAGVLLAEPRDASGELGFGGAGNRDASLRMEGEQDPSSSSQYLLCKGLGAVGGVIKPAADELLQSCLVRMEWGELQPGPPFPCPCPQYQHLPFPMPGTGVSPGEVQGGGLWCDPLCFLADGERPGEVTDPGRRPAAPARRRKAEDSSESREEDPMVTGQEGPGEVTEGRVLQVSSS